MYISDPIQLRQEFLLRAKGRVRKEHEIFQNRDRNLRKNRTAKEIQDDLDDLMQVVVVATANDIAQFQSKLDDYEQQAVQNILILQQERDQKLAERDAMIGAAGSSTNTSLQLNRNNDQNLQGRKLDFLNQKTDGKIYNPHKLQTPASPYQVMAGTIISASLITGINSDLPGNVIAQVTENVYDTATGGYLLIPQGARMMGTYDSVVAFGQERALLVWQRIILPDGTSIVIDNLPGTDTAGYAGLEDKVNFHTWKLLKGIVLSTLLGVSTELTFGNQESDLVKAIRETAQDSANQVGQSLTERSLNIQPTITIRPGWPLRIIVNKDMILKPYTIEGAIR